MSVSSGNYVYRDQSALALETYDNGTAVANLGQLQHITQASGIKLVAVNSTTSTVPIVAPAAGYLLSLTDPFGRSIGFTYKSIALSSGNSVVINQITDPTGQTITAGYDSNANLTSLTWQDLSKTTFVYDSPNANQSWALTGVIDENTKRYATFTYDPAGWAKSTSLNGGVYAFQASYTTAPQPVIREVPDLTNNVVWRYHEWQAGSGASVSQPNGSSLGMNFKTIAGSTGASGGNLLRFAGYGQPAGSGCAASTSNIDWDNNGNVKLEDDFNGHRTCYVYSTASPTSVANLETSRIEGLLNSNSCDAAFAATSSTGFTNSPAETRKNTTKWHPDWALKVQQAEPHLLTTWVYNGQPDPFNSNQILTCTSAKYGAASVAALPDDGSGTVKPIAVLCKKVEQATTDSTGLQGLSPTLDNSDTTITSQRQWTYTYNQYGQVLTSTGPQGTITNTYYCQDSATCDGTNKYSFSGTSPNESGHYQGDLYTVTNQAGHVTTYNSYDKAGRVLSMSDPNGLVAAYTYWPRGWVKASKQCSGSGACDASTSGGGLRTTYDYWPTGLLKLVTQPDGGTLSYAYDDAHRLTDVTDNLGNTVHYTLDNAGNRKAEDFKDLSGNLTRNISRTFDALNRLQLVTGAAQ